jgi:hypothetical protein
MGTTDPEMETAMIEHGDDAGHCANGLTAQRFRDATAEERKTYRKWIRGMIAFYGVLLLAGALTLINFSDSGLTQLTNLSGHRAAAPQRTN